MAKFSEELRTSALQAMADAFGNCELRIFAVDDPENIPANAASEEYGTLLMTLFEDGDENEPLLLSVDNGLLTKDPGQVWSTNSIYETGKCAYFRLVQYGDDGSANSTAIRIQGTCGYVGADMILSSLDVTQGNPWTLSYFNITLPTL